MDILRGHIIYDNIKEAEANGKTVVLNWRDGQKDDWVLTDDGTVIKIKSRLTMLPKDGRKTRYDTVYTVWGSVLFSRNGKQKLSATEKYGSRKKTLTYKQKSFVRLYCLIFDPVKAYQTVYGVTKPSATILHKRLMKMEKIQKAIEDRINEVLNKHGKGEDFYIKELVKAIEQGTPCNKLEAIKFMAFLQDGVSESGKIPQAAGGLFDQLGIGDIEDAQMVETGDNGKEKLPRHTNRLNKKNMPSKN